MKQIYIEKSFQKFSKPYQSNWADERLYEVPNAVENIKYNIKSLKDDIQPPPYDVSYLPCGGVNGRLTANGFKGNLNIGRYIRYTVYR